MKFALSTADTGWPSATVSAAAKALGYDGIEINPPAAAPPNPESLNLKVACVAAAGELPPPEQLLAQSPHLRTLIDLASHLGCEIVKITDPAPRPGHDRAASGSALGDWLLPLADYAADRSVSLALCDTQSLRSARETWAILDRLNHPSVGCCLDLLTMARTGQPPQVVVPMLNSRIIYVQVSDVKDLADPASDCDLGDGVLPIRTTLARLRGIGYQGWVTVVGQESFQAIEPRLSRGIAVLRAMTTPVEKTKAKTKPAPATPK